MLDRSQHFNDFQIVPSCNNCQCALARGWNEIVDRQPFRNSLSHTELCQPSLSKYDRVELSLVQSLQPSLHVSEERLWLHIRPRTSQLGDSYRAARSNPATHGQVLQPSVSATDKNLCWRTSLWDARDHQSRVPVSGRHVLHVLDCKVDPAFHESLVNFFVEYSSLLEGKPISSLAHDAGGLDDFSVYL